MENKTINLIYQPGIPKDEQGAVRRATSKLASLLDISPSNLRESGAEVQEGRRRLEDYIKRNKNSFNSQILVNGFQGLADSKYPNSLNFYVLKDDISVSGLNYILGIGFKSQGAIISSYRLQNLDDFWKTESLETLADHEGAHVFGANECLNSPLCACNQPLSVKELVDQTRKRLLVEDSNLYPWCESCQNDMKTYLREHSNKKTK